MKIRGFLLFVILLAWAPSLEANTQPVQKVDKKFISWTKKLWPRARRYKISRKTFNAAFKDVKSPDQEVFDRANNQAEFVKPLWEYIENRVHEKRVEEGKKHLKELEKTLLKIQKKYGVDRHVLVAIWALESNYGSHKGDKNIVRSLATLAYKGKRRRFGRSQLMAALKILQRGDVKPSNMLGSWAGAMGHTQFIPTTYNAYAVDYDKDGKRDIWQNPIDALASTANYLRVSKWKTGQTWGYEVKLPKKFNYALAGRRSKKSIKAWKALGIKRVNGKKFPRLRDRATLRLPSGAKGPAFLILPNFRSILRYNFSFAYALSVGHMADRLRGQGRFVTPWPVAEETIVLRSEREEVQKLLKAKGYKIDKIDGIFGENTENAVKQYQKKQGYITDGIATKSLLKELREN